MSRPYSLDRAVDDEQEFWRHIRSIIREEVELATRDMVKAVKSLEKTHKLLIERMAEVGAQQAGLVASYDRLASWCTVKGADDDALRLRLDKFFELITPHPPAKTPP